MLLLDLFCGAGFAARGYQAAGWDTVGVDIVDQPHYPGPFLKLDALQLDPRFISMFDGIHASPPCQALTSMRFAKHAKAHVNLIPPTRAMLEASGKPYVIENVDSNLARQFMPGAVTLCGSHFGLETHGYHLQRHRLFQANFEIPQPQCAHQAPVIGVYGGHVRNRAAGAGGRGTRDFIGMDKKMLALEAFGLDPFADSAFTMDEISQGFPPVYTRHVGKAMQVHLRTRAVDAAMWRRCFPDGM